MTNRTNNGNGNGDNGRRMIEENAILLAEAREARPALVAAKGADNQAYILAWRGDATTKKMPEFIAVSELTGNPNDRTVQDAIAAVLTYDGEQWRLFGRPFAIWVTGKSHAEQTCDAFFRMLNVAAAWYALDNKEAYLARLGMNGGEIDRALKRFTMGDTDETASKLITAAGADMLQDKSWLSTDMDTFTEVKNLKVPYSGDPKNPAIFLVSLLGLGARNGVDDSNPDA